MADAEIKKTTELIHKRLELYICEIRNSHSTLGWGQKWPTKMHNCVN